MQSYYVNGVKGLSTEKSPMQSDPESMSDNLNAVFSRDGLVTARHGHQPIEWQTAGNQPFQTKHASSIFKYVQQGAGTAVSTYYPIVATDANGHHLYVYTKAGDAPLDVTFNATYVGATAFDPPNTNKVAVANTTPRAFKYDEKLFTLTDNGLYQINSDLSGTIAPLVFPTVRSVAPTLISTPANMGRYEWLARGNRVQIKCVLEKEQKWSGRGSRTITSPVTDPVTVNYTVEAGGFTDRVAPRITVTYSTSSMVGYVLKVYRTVQYGLGEAAPTSFYQCSPDIELENSATSVIDLIINDDGIIDKGTLYTDPNNEGALGENSTPYPAKDVLKHKDYFLYTAPAKPAVARLALNTIPTGSSTLTVKIKNGAGTTIYTSTVNVFDQYTDIRNTEYVSSAYVPAFTSSIAAAQDLTYQGQHTTGASTPLPLKTVILPVTTALKNGRVQPHGTTTAAITMNSEYSSERNIKVDTSAGEFQIGKFEEPGHCAITNSAGDVVFIFSYETIAQIPGKYTEFENCKAIGVPFPGVVTLFSAATRHFYYIPGASPENFGLYKTSVAGTHLSLLPTINCLQDPVAFPNPLGALSATFLSYAGNFSIVPFYVGLLRKSPAQLLASTVSGMVDHLNTNNANPTKYKFVKSVDDPTSFFVVSTSGECERIDASVTGTATFEPPLTSSDLELAKAEVVKNGITISKFASPEIVPFAKALTPLTIGGPDEGIVKAIATNDEVYIFKDQSIHRMTISGGTTIAQIDNVTLFDSTTWCLAENSVQELNEGIYFISQKGFCVINNGGIDTISRSIETEVKNAISKSKSAGMIGKVRSFANEAKRLYGCYIPTSDNPRLGVTFVYDTYTREWAKWDLEFDASYVDEHGRLTTLFTQNLIYMPDPATGVTSIPGQQNFDRTVGTTNTPYWQYLKTDAYTGGDPQSALDQWDGRYVLDNTTADRTLTGNSLQIFLMTAPPPLIGTYPTELPYYFAERVRYQASYFVDVSTGVLHPVVLSIAEVTVAFASMTFLFIDTVPPVVSNGDYIVFGVRLNMTFNPIRGTNPSSMKQFTEFQVHTDENVKNLGVAFKVDTRTTYSNIRVFTNLLPTNRTVYRTFIPLEATRGRFLYRQIYHNYPLEKVAINGQMLQYREMGTTRNQKDSGT